MRSGGHLFINVCVGIYEIYVLASFGPLGFVDVSSTKSCGRELHEGKIFISECRDGDIHSSNIF